MKKSEFLERVEFVKSFLSKGFEDYMKGYTTGEDFQDLMRIAVRLIPMYDVPYNDEVEDYEEAFQNAPNDCEMKKCSEFEIKMREECVYEFIDDLPNWDSSHLTLKGSNTFLSMFIPDYIY
jgi:hypothetical protein